MWTYESILKPRLTHPQWFERNEMKKKPSEVTLEKMRGLVLRGTTGLAGSRPTAALGTLLGIEPSQNSISVQATRVYCRIEDTQGVTRIKEGRSRKLRAKRVLGMHSGKIT